MIVYQLNPDGYFLYQTEADESPREPGVYHIPAHCVLDAPPEIPENMCAKFSEENGWEVVDFPKRQIEIVISRLQLRKWLLKNGLRTPDIRKLIAESKDEFIDEIEIEWEDGNLFTDKNLLVKFFQNHLEISDEDMEDVMSSISLIV